MDLLNQVPHFQTDGNTKHDRMAKLVFQHVLMFSLEQFYKHNAPLIISKHFVDLELLNISLVFYMCNFNTSMQNLFMSKSDNYICTSNIAIYLSCNHVFENVGLDFAGPLYYMNNNGNNKSY